MANVKLLNGSDLAGFIKERQAQTVRALKQSAGVVPRMVILRSDNSAVTDIYLRLKQSYGQDIGVMVDIEHHEDTGLTERIDALNKDQSVHGIVVQLPLKDQTKTNDVLAIIAPEKDVDGLGDNSIYDSATAIAINWLVAGYNIELSGKQIVIVGQGRLVGSPLYRMWQASGYNVKALDVSTENNRETIANADVIVTATGVPGLITEDIVKLGTIVIDAGVASENGQLVGDVSETVRKRDDVTITPVKGGVGPLTVCALFDNLLRATQL